MHPSERKDSTIREAAHGVLLGVTFLVVWSPFGPSGLADASSYNIYELQYSGPGLDWKSPHCGEIVRCTGGIVTHKFRQRFTLQDPSLGSEWVAIEVRGYPVYPTGIEVGDQVDFDNVYVDEYRGVTVLQYYNQSSHVVNSSGHPLPDPLEVPVWNLRYPAHPEDCERYASMLITTPGPLTVGALDLGAHQDNYELVDNLGVVAWASDYANIDLDSTYYVTSGDCYIRMTGVIQRYDDDTTYDCYQLLPRGIADYVPCGTAVDEEREIAAGLRLAPPYPNPCDRMTAVSFGLLHQAHLRLEVLDASGRCVGLLFDGVCSGADHTVFWDGRDAAGRRLPNGVYLMRAAAAGCVLAQRVCVVGR